jgi:hypothetical protein
METPEMISPPNAGDSRAPQSVAPAWHTVVLLGLLLAFSLLSARSQHRFSAAHGPMALYLLTIVWEWVLVGYVVFGLRRRRVSLRELAGGRWSSTQAVLSDFFIAVGFWLAAAVVLGLLGYAIGLGQGSQFAETRQKLGFLAPRGSLEVGIFLVLSASAGFCEEIIFRGYLQRQFAAWTHSVAAGAILQAVVFGAGHGYEGPARMFLIAIFGAMFAVLALARHSLRPGMLAHFLHDAAAGLALRNLMR